MADVLFTARSADGVTLEGDPVKVDHSRKISLVVKVNRPAQGQTYKVTLAHGTETPLSNADVPDEGKAYPIESVNKAEHSGAWTASVVDSAGTNLDNKTLNLEVTEEAAPPAEPPGVYQPGFATGVGIAIGVVFLAVVVLMAIVLVDRKVSEVPVVWVLAFGLFTIGVLLAAVGAFFVALEVRGKLVSAKDKTTLSARGIDLKDAATLIDAVGKLRGTTAVLVLAAVCLVSSAWIGYGSTQPNSPATVTTTTTLP